MAESITIMLPLPGRVLNPNGRSHWRKKAKAVKVYRQRAADEARLAVMDSPDLCVPWSRATIEVYCYHKTATLMDADNILASLKSAFDGLVDAGVLADDRDVTYQPVVRKVDRDNPRVALKVSEN